MVCAPLMLLHLDEVLNRIEESGMEHTLGAKLTTVRDSEYDCMSMMMSLAHVRIPWSFAIRPDRDSAAANNHTQ